MKIIFVIRFGQKKARVVGHMPVKEWLKNYWADASLSTSVVSPAGALRLSAKRLICQSK
jgi:hypothetical protein